MKRVVTLALAVIGAITILVGAVFAIMGGGSDYKIERSLPSPDGSRIATLYTGMGGGAAGWCSQVISVNTGSDPFSLETEKKSGAYQVFRANCTAKVAFRWLSDSVLHIEFSAADQGDSLSLYMRPTDQSGQVTVKYAFGA